MKKVFWMTSEGLCAEQWNHYIYFELLLQDLTGFNFKESLCAESIKYMAKRLADTIYSKRFREKYTIFEDEYYILVKDFQDHANTNRWIEVNYEKEKVC
jgi:hypothetical protein